MRIMCVRGIYRNDLYTDSRAQKRHRFWNKINIPLLSVELPGPIQGHVRQVGNNSSNSKSSNGSETHQPAPAILSQRLVSFRKWLKNDAHVKIHSSICIVTGEATDGTKNASTLLYGPSSPVTSSLSSSLDSVSGCNSNGGGSGGGSSSSDSAAATWSNRSRRCGMINPEED